MSPVHLYSQVFSNTVSAVQEHVTSLHVTSRADSVSGFEKEHSIPAVGLNTQDTFSDS